MYKGECEASFFELFIPSKSNKKLIICSLYRHPHNSYNEFYEVLTETLSKLENDVPLILAGDVNINVSSQNIQSKNYKNFLLSLGLRNLI